MKHRNLTIGIVILLAGTTLLGMESAQQSSLQLARADGLPGLGEPRPPAVQWVGAASNISTPGFRRITDRKAWTELWTIHRGDLADRSPQGWVVPPEIDFDRYMVIARFTGKATHNYGERASSVLRRGNVLVVRYDSSTSQTAMLSDDEEAVGTGTPFGIWVVERFDGPVIVEEDHNRLIGADPVWKQVHRFAALPSD